MNTANECKCTCSVEESFARVLSESGVELTRGRAETPARYAKFLREALNQPPINFKIFEETDLADGLLVQNGITFSSLCEHHVLPFMGTVSVGFVHSGGRICGLSKLARIVQHFTAGLQIQERVCQQIGKFLFEHPDFKPIGVGVSIRSYHTCMIARGVRQHSAVTITNSLFGQIHDNPELRAEFLGQVCHPQLF